MVNHVLASPVSVFLTRAFVSWAQLLQSVPQLTRKGRVFGGTGRFLSRRPEKCSCQSYFTCPSSPIWVPRRRLRRLEEHGSFVLGGAGVASPAKDFCPWSSNRFRQPSRVCHRWCRHGDTDCTWLPEPSLLFPLVNPVMRPPTKMPLSWLPLRVPGRFHFLQKSSSMKRVEKC